MMVAKPEGVSINSNGSKMQPHFSCAIASKGRRGAWVRARLMRMNDLQRQPVLHAWCCGETVEFKIAEGE